MICFEGDVEMITEVEGDIKRTWTNWRRCSDKLG